MNLQKEKTHNIMRSVDLTYPDKALENLYKKIPHHIWVTFLSACALGLLVHMYIFTKKLPNHDDIGHLFGSTYGVASGRWLLPLIMKLDGSFSMPWLIGTLSVILLAVSACLTVSVMRIRNSLGCILTSAIMVAFPAVAATFTYMFSADAYFLSLALACFAAYISNKYRFGFIFGIVAVTLSMGIYQSYFGVAAVLMVSILIFDTLDNELSTKQIILKGLKFISTLAIGLSLYLVIVKLTTRTTGLVDYMGISQMGKFSLTQVPNLIVEAYCEYYRFYFKNSFLAHFEYLKYAFVLTAAATAFLGIKTIQEKKLKRVSIVLLFVLVAIFPLAGNIIRVMVPNAQVHMVMLYGMIFILIAALALSEYYISITSDSADRKVKWKRSIYAVCCWVITITVAISAYSYAIFTNDVYLKMELSYEQAYAYSNRLLSAIESTDGYDVNMPVALVGSALENVEFEPSPELNELNMVGVQDMKELINSYTYGYFLRRFLGSSNIVYDTASKISIRYQDADDVKAMPCYPSSGSIIVKDNFLIVKLGEK